MAYIIVYQNKNMYKLIKDVKNLYKLKCGGLYGNKSNEKYSYYKEYSI